MTARRLLPVALLAVAALAAAQPDAARACSCAPLDPRERLEDGEPAVIGRVVEVRHPKPERSTDLSRYVLRVGRALNVRLGDRVVVRSPWSSASCGVSWRVGQRVGAFLTRGRRGWRTHLCSEVRPSELKRAARGLPAAAARPLCLR